MSPAFFDSTRSGKTVIVRLQDGRFPREMSLPQFRDELIQLAQRQSECKSIAIDIRGMTLIASSVLACLVDVLRYGFAIELLNVSKNIQQHLEITRLDELIRVHPEEPTR